jgi:hypothetical protein
LQRLCWREENLGFLLSLAMLDVLAIVILFSVYLSQRSGTSCDRSS